MSVGISVAICIYNGAKYIEEQLNSIINQSIQPDEIIVCDDCSSDGSIDIISNVLQNTLIKYKIIKNEVNIGVIKNFEKALINCSGEYIFLSDQDDVWVYDKIEKIISYFNTDINTKVIFTDAELVNHNLKKMNIALWETIDKNIYNLKTQDDLFEFVLNHNIMTGATMAIKSDFLDEILPFTYFWMHDYWIAINSILHSNYLMLPEKLILYRQHESNVIGAKKFNFVKRVHIYLKNIKKLDEIRVQKFAMLNQLYIKYQYNSNIKCKHLEMIRNCKEFWRKLTNIKEMSKIESLLLISNELKNGNYKLYYTGFIGYIRDVISII